MLSSWLARSLPEVSGAIPTDSTDYWNSAHIQVEKALRGRIPCYKVSIRTYVLDNCP